MIGLTPLLKYAPAGLQMTMKVTCWAGRTPRKTSLANMNGRRYRLFSPAASGTHRWSTAPGPRRPDEVVDREHGQRELK